MDDFAKAIVEGDVECAEVECLAEDIEVARDKLLRK